MGVQKQNENV